jgi:hypothetical protein
MAAPVGKESLFAICDIGGAAVLGLQRYDG